MAENGEADNAINSAFRSACKRVRELVLIHGTSIGLHTWHINVYGTW
jgi:hypothetical protein